MRAVIYDANSFCLLVLLAEVKWQLIENWWGCIPNNGRHAGIFFLLARLALLRSHRFYLVYIDRYMSCGMRNCFLLYIYMCVCRFEQNVFRMYMDSNVEIVAIYSGWITTYVVCSVKRFRYEHLDIQIFVVITSDEHWHIGDNRLFLLNWTVYQWPG